MIGLDTNVLVRYLVDDDPKQSAEAARMIEAAIESDRELFIPRIVLCELVWVLSFAYELDRVQILAVLNQLRRASQVVVEDPDGVRRAAELYASHKGDFADYLIEDVCRRHGCQSVATFDKALIGHELFRAPSASL